MTRDLPETLPITKNMCRWCMPASCEVMLVNINLCDIGPVTEERCCLCKNDSHCAVNDFELAAVHRQEILGTMEYEERGVCYSA